MLRRDVHVRGIYAAEALEIPGVLAHAHEAVAAGEQAQVGVVVPTKLAIADRRLAIVAADVGPAGRQRADRALVLAARRAGGAVRAAVADRLPLPGAAQHDAADADADAGPDPDLMTLLMAGLKDEAVARQLGVSLRTVHRRTSTLMEG